MPFLERAGGIAADLPGFGRSSKRGDFDFTIEGYGRWLDRFAEHVGLERVRLVVHDWGAGAGLPWAMRRAERVERLAIVDAVPLLPGYRWHRVARVWRTRGLGEVAVGLTTRFTLRRALPRPVAELAWPHFDQGTQRAILRLYRGADPAVLAAAGARPRRAARARARGVGRGRPVRRRRASRRPTRRRSAGRPRCAVSRAPGTGSGTSGPRSPSSSRTSSPARLARFRPGVARTSAALPTSHKDEGGPMKRMPPALVVACLATLLFAVPAAPAEAGLDRFERSVINQVNYIRAAHGRRPMGVSSRLSRRAARHSRRMARGGRMFHGVRRGGETVGFISGRRVARRSSPCGCAPARTATRCSAAGSAASASAGAAAAAGTSSPSAWGTDPSAGFRGRSRRRSPSPT